MEKDNRNVNEIDKSQVGVLLATTLVPFILQLSVAFLMLFALKKATKQDLKLTAQLKKYLNDGKDWKVHIVKEKLPNAFVIMDKSVFITTGLMKMMTERETMAVMLHEIGHLKNHDVVKSVASSSILGGILMTVIYSMSGGLLLVIPQLWFFALFSVKIFADVFVGRTYGRHAENKADNFAVKNGYGDELVSALNKLEKLINKFKAKEREKYPCGQLCKISEKIGEFLDEHPPMKKRTETILKKKETWQQATGKSFTQFRSYLFKQFGVSKPEK